MTLRAQKAKDSERLLFLILGLTHLREWIAPGYTHVRGRGPQSKAEAVHGRIWDLESFALLRAIANHTKHLAPLNGVVDVGEALPMAEWPSVEAVQSFDQGPPTAYRLDGRDVLDAIDDVIAFYDSQWFNTQEPPS